MYLEIGILNIFKSKKSTGPYMIEKRNHEKIYKITQEILFKYCTAW